MEETEMKKIIALLLAVLMIVSLAACGASEPAPTEPAKVETPVADAGNEPAKSDKPYEGTTLKVLAANLATTIWMYDHLDEFEAETGIEVVVEELDLEQINTKTMVAMTAGGSEVDVLFFQPDKYVDMYTTNGWLEPLDEYLKDEEFDFADFNEATYALGNINGSEYYLPLYGCEHSVVFYNKEMINTAGIDVNAIKTWDDLTEAAKTVEEKIPDVAGITLRGQGYNLVTVVINNCRAYGGDFLDENGNAAVNTPGFIEGLLQYREMLEYAPEGWPAQTLNETINIFAQKMAAFRVDTLGSYPYMINAENSQLRDGDVGFLPLPAGSVRAATTTGNWGMAMSSGSKNKGAAWEFMKWKTSKEAVLDQTLNYGAIPARISVMNNEQVAGMYPEGYMECLLESGKIAFGNTLPDITYSGEARTLLGAAIDEVYAGGDAQAIMDRANEELQALIDQEREEKGIK